MTFTQDWHNIRRPSVHLGGEWTTFLIPDGVFRTGSVETRWGIVAAMTRKSKAEGDFTVLNFVHNEVSNRRVFKKAYSSRYVCTLANRFACYVATLRIKVAMDGGVWKEWDKP